MERNGSSRETSGQAAVEFTLVFLLFLLLMYMIVEGSRATFAFSSASQAARSAVRWASVRGSTSKCASGCPASVDDIKNYAIAQAPGAYVKAVDVCWWQKAPDCTKNPHKADYKEPGSNVRVTVKVDFKPVLPMYLLPKNTITMSSTAEMAISN